VHLHDAVDDGGIGEQIVVVPRSTALADAGDSSPGSKLAVRLPGGAL